MAGVAGRWPVMEVRQCRRGRRAGQERPLAPGGVGYGFCSCVYDTVQLEGAGAQTAGRRQHGMEAAPACALSTLPSRNVFQLATSHLVLPCTSMGVACVGVSVVVVRTG